MPKAKLVDSHGGDGEGWIQHLQSGPGGAVTEEHWVSFSQGLGRWQGPTRALRFLQHLECGAQRLERESGGSSRPPSFMRHIDASQRPQSPLARREGPPHEEPYEESERVGALGRQSKEELLASARSYLQELAAANWELVKNRKKWRHDSRELHRYRQAELSRQFRAVAPKVIVAQHLAAREAELAHGEESLRREKARLAADEAALAQEREEVAAERSKARKTMQDLTKKAEALLRQEQQAPKAAPAAKGTVPQQLSPPTTSSSPAPLTRLQADIVAKEKQQRPQWVVYLAVCIVSALLARLF